MKLSLIGMTGAGKTTVGQILSQRLGYNFLDTDAIIREQTQKTPAEIFAESGEEVFRDIESEVLESILADNYKNIVLSCGGGIILREKNRGLLRQNSYVVWLIRPFEEILKNQEILSRPPVNGKPCNYIEIFKARESLYAQTCRFRVDFRNADEAADRIIAEIT